MTVQNMTNNEITLESRFNQLIGVLERQYAQAQQPPKKLFTRKEAALYMQISEKTLDRIMKNKSFYPAARIGFGTGCIRINRDKLDKWIDEQDGSYKV